MTPLGPTLTDYRLPRPGWLRRPWIYAEALLLIAALVALFMVYQKVTDASCGPGVNRMGQFGECIGVTDGRVVFATDEPFRSKEKELEDKILAQNQAVTEPYVSIALLTPLTLQPTDSETEDSLLHELVGAYAA